MEVIIATSACFVMITVIGLCAFSSLVTHYRQYRRYFENRVNNTLQQAFIKQPIAKLFLLETMLLCVCGLLGWIFYSVFGLIFGIILAGALPFALIKRIKRKRAEKFLTQLPDGLHALSASLRSGANMSRGLEQLANWQPVPLSQEMGLVVAETEFGKTLEESLESLRERVPSQEVELMNTAIVFSKSVGGNVSDTLETLALTLTEKQSVEGKVKALTSTGRMQGFVAMAIPVLVGTVIVTAQPDKLDFFLNDIRGWVTLAIVFAMMVAAHYSIKRIVNIDI